MKKKKEEEIVKFYPTYSVSIDDKLRFFFKEFDKAKYFFNDLKNIVRSKPRLVVVNAVEESEYDLPTSLTNIVLRKEFLSIKKETDMSGVKIL